jgi:hypothetical protein
MSQLPSLKYLRLQLSPAPPWTGVRPASMPPSAVRRRLRATDYPSTYGAKEFTVSARASGYHHSARSAESLDRRSTCRSMHDGDAPRVLRRSSPRHGTSWLILRRVRARVAKRRFIRGSRLGRFSRERKRDPARQHAEIHLQDVYDAHADQTCIVLARERSGQLYSRPGLRYSLPRRSGIGQYAIGPALPAVVSDRVARFVAAHIVVAPHAIRSLARLGVRLADTSLRSRRMFSDSDYADMHPRHRIRPNATFRWPEGQPTGRGNGPRPSGPRRQDTPSAGPPVISSTPRAVSSAPLAGRTKG